MWLNMGSVGETRIFLLNIRQGNIVKYIHSWEDKNITARYKAGKYA